MNNEFTQAPLRGDILLVNVDGVIRPFYVNAPVTKIVNGRYCAGDRYATPCMIDGSIRSGSNWKVTFRGLNGQVYIGGHKVIGRV